MDFEKLNSLLMGELHNDSAAKSTTATANRSIGNLTNSRVQNLLSRLSTTGLGRSGIGGLALNEAYGSAAEAYGSAAAKGAELDQNNRSNIIAKLMQLYKYKGDQDYQAQNTAGVGDIFGSIAGLVGGSALGKVGSGIGDKLSGLII